MDRLSESIYTTRKDCRACGRSLKEYLDLGEQHLSTFLPPGSDFGPKVPLVLTRCLSCNLVQLRDTVQPDHLYRRYYYRSGINEGMRAHLAEIAHQAEQVVDLHEGDTVLDIGANDGTLLASYTIPGLCREAIEPALNLQDVLEEKLLTGKIDSVENDYFDGEQYLDYRLMKQCPPALPKVITAIAMMYDLDDPHTFLADIKKVLAPDGVFVVEMSYLKAMLDTGAYDTLCHEHVITWSTETFNACVQQHDLAIRSVSYNQVNGGSVRYLITHKGHASDRDFLGTYSLEAALVRERMLDYRLDVFAEQVRQHRYHLLGRLYYEREYNIIVGLGASTKGNTVLGYCGMGRDLLPFIVDRDPRKDGLVTPTGIPIVHESHPFEDTPDMYYVGIWQFLPQLKERHADWLAQGGKFLVPFPHPHVEGAE